MGGQNKRVDANRLQARSHVAWPFLSPTSKKGTAGTMEPLAFNEIDN